MPLVNWRQLPAAKYEEVCTSTRKTSADTCSELASKSQLTVPVSILIRTSSANCKKPFVIFCNKGKSIFTFDRLTKQLPTLIFLQDCTN